MIFDGQRLTNFSRVKKRGLTRSYIEAGTETGRNIDDWKLSLEKELLEEFGRSCKIGKFSKLKFQKRPKSRSRYLKIKK